MKVLLDMNLSPAWVAFLEAAGTEAKHWSTVGSPSAPDSELMAWARHNGYILFTNDLDFSVLLALSRESKPSVLQLRMRDLMPAAVGNLVVSVLHQHRAALDDGAILTVDAQGSRVRILPLNPGS